VVSEVIQNLRNQEPCLATQFKDIAFQARPIRRRDDVEELEPSTQIAKRPAVEAHRYPLIFESTVSNPTHDITILYREGRFEIDVRQHGNIALPDRVTELLTQPLRTNDEKIKWIQTLANLSAHLTTISITVRGIQEQRPKFQALYVASPVHGTGSNSSGHINLTLKAALSNILSEAHHLKLYPVSQVPNTLFGRRFSPISDRYTSFRNRTEEQKVTSPKGCIVVSPHYSAARDALTQLINAHPSIRTVLVIGNSQGESSHFRWELSATLDRTRKRDGRLTLEAIGKKEILDQQELGHWDVIVLLQPETFMKYSDTDTTMTIVQKLDSTENSFIVLYTGTLLSNDVSNLWTPLRILHPQYRSDESGLATQRASIRTYMNQKLFLPEESKDQLRILHRTVQCLVAPATGDLKASRITVRRVLIAPNSIEQTAISEIRQVKTNNPKRAQMNRKIMVDVGLVNHESDDQLGSKVTQILTQIEDIRYKRHCHLAIVIPTDTVAEKVAQILTDSFGGEMNPPELFLANQGKHRTYNQTLEAYVGSNSPCKILILHSSASIPWVPLSSTDLILFNVTVNLSFYQKMIGLAAIRRNDGNGLRPETPLEVSYFVQDAAAFADAERLTELATLGQLDQWFTTPLPSGQLDPMPLLAARALRGKTTPPSP
jgi:hypothetical protein